jgi:hypothetical protein
LSCAGPRPPRRSQRRYSRAGSGLRKSLRSCKSRAAPSWASANSAASGSLHARNLAAAARCSCGSVNTIPFGAGLSGSSMDVANQRSCSIGLPDHRAFLTSIHDPALAKSSHVAAARRTCACPLLDPGTAFLLIDRRYGRPELKGQDRWRGVSFPISVPVRGIQTFKFLSVDLIGRSGRI